MNATSLCIMGTATYNECYQSMYNGYCYIQWMLLRFLFILVRKCGLAYVMPLIFWTTNTLIAIKTRHLTWSPGVSYLSKWLAVLAQSHINAHNFLHHNTTLAIQHADNVMGFWLEVNCVSWGHTICIDITELLFLSETNASVWYED